MQFSWIAILLLLKDTVDTVLPAKLNDLSDSAYTFLGNLQAGRQSPMKQLDSMAVISLKRAMAGI